MVLDSIGGIKATPRKEPTGFARSTEGFLYGLAFTYLDIKELKGRDPITYYWTHGITDEALGDGFHLVDMKGEKIPEDEKLQEFFESENFLQEFIQLISFSRAYGLSGGLVFNNAELKAFEPSNLTFTFDSKARKFTEIICKEDYGWGIATEKDHTLKTKDQISKFVMCILNEGAKTFQGESVLEPIWDTINSLWIVNFSATLYCVRVGAGIKILYSDEAKTGAEADTIDNSLRNMSQSLILHLAKDDKLEYKTSGDGGMINFTQIADILFTHLSAGTSVPMAKWRGLIAGEQEGAKVNKALYYNVLKTIQDKSTFYLKKIIKLIQPYAEFTLPDKFVVEWNYKEELSEEEKANLEQVIANTATLRGNYMTGNEIREELGLDKLKFFAGDNETIPMNMATNANTIGIDVQGFQDNESIPPTLDEKGQELEDNPDDKDKETEEVANE